LFEHEDIQISWTGHDGYKIRGTNSQNSQLTIYVDPYQLSPKYHNQNDADVVLLTHDHFDHLSIDDLKQIVNNNTSIAAATECVEKLAELKLKEIRGLKPGEKTIVKGLTIEAVPAYLLTPLPSSSRRVYPRDPGRRCRGRLVCSSAVRGQVREATVVDCAELCCIWRVERVANKAIGFEEARRWERQQYAEMDPDERRRVAKVLRDRVYGKNCPDVRDAVAGLRHVRRPR
jgi:hypothetical protein